MCQNQIGIYIKQIPFGKPTHAQNTEKKISQTKHVGYILHGKSKQIYS